MTTPSNANTSGLAPCPFCGGEAWLNDYDAKYSDLPPMSRAPQCRSCGASLGYLTTPAKATEAWNRRVTAASAQAEREARLAAAPDMMCCDNCGTIRGKSDECDCSRHDGTPPVWVSAAPASPLPGGENEALIAELKEARRLLKPFAVYYEINDLDERLADDTIEVPVGDLRLARAFLARNGKGEG